MRKTCPFGCPMRLSSGRGAEAGLRAPRRRSPRSARMWFSRTRPIVHYVMTDADGLRASLRADLISAMKARDADTVTALRTAIAAIENAEAVEASHDPV